MHVTACTYPVSTNHTGRNRGDDTVHHTKVVLLMARDTKIGTTQGCERLICNTKIKCISYLEHTNSQWYRILRKITQGTPSRAPVLTNWVAGGLAILVHTQAG